jgi:hypothetical protein
MFTWERANELQRDATLAATFTPEEFIRLQALREQYETSQDCGEFGLDERHLRFARWLVEHGRLSEEV